MNAQMNEGPRRRFGPRGLHGCFALQRVAWKSFIRHIF
jgi:hypothetical protein